jgi:hypothetical protein
MNMTADLFIMILIDIFRAGANEDIIKASYYIRHKIKNVISHQQVVCFKMNF